MADILNRIRVDNILHTWVIPFGDRIVKSTPPPVKGGDGALARTARNLYIAARSIASCNHCPIRMGNGHHNKASRCAPVFDGCFSSHSIAVRADEPRPRKPITGKAFIGVVEICFMCLESRASVDRIGVVLIYCFPLLWAYDKRTRRIDRTDTVKNPRQSAVFTAYSG